MDWDIRRCVLLANCLIQKFSVTILCSSEKIAKFKLNKSVKIKNFEIKSTKRRYLKKE